MLKLPPPSPPLFPQSHPPPPRPPPSTPNPFPFPTKPSDPSTLDSAGYAQLSLLHFRAFWLALSRWHDRNGSVQFLRTVRAWPYCRVAGMTESWAIKAWLLAVQTVWNLPYQVYDQIEWTVKSSRLPECLCLFSSSITPMRWVVCWSPKSLLQDLDLTSQGLHNFNVSIPRPVEK